MSVVCYTQYVRPSLEVCPYEEHPDEGVVQRTGYMRTQQLVEQFLSAGARRRAYQEGMYGEDGDGDAEETPVPVYASAQDVLLRAREHRTRLADRARINAEAAASAEAQASAGADGSSNAPVAVQ